MVDQLRMGNPFAPPEQSVLDLYTCPDDPDPRMIPALLCRLYSGNTYRGMTSSDAIFNRIRTVAGNRWQIDIQDQLEDMMFGGDAGSNGELNDLLLEYTPTRGQKFTVEPNVANERAWRYHVLSYDGKTLHAEDLNGGGSPATGWSIKAPMMALSYGANAFAGLRNVKGSPALIVEITAKFGIFPGAAGQFPRRQPRLGSAIPARWSGWYQGNARRLQVHLLVQSARSQLVSHSGADG